MKLKLFLTFDHELPLGMLKTSYQEALFNPTQQVMDVAKKHNVPVTLFTDILCAYRFSEWDNTNFYVPYRQQLQYAIANGHDVQLHLHPHWLTSTFVDNQYLPSNDFALSDFQHSPHSISDIVKLGVQHLGQICKPADPLYKCVAFRAGGYNIAPCTNQIFDALEKNGILYDSSMAKGYYFKSTISEVDFRHLPKMPNWKINPENLSLCNKNGGITEIPIASIPKTPFEVPTLFKMKKYAFRAPISHGNVIHEDRVPGFKAKRNMMFSARMLSFDNYTLSLEYLMKILDFNLRKYKKSDEIMLSIISHPKSMSQYSFHLMDNFIAEVKRKYQDVEFLTYSRI